MQLGRWGRDYVFDALVVALGVAAQVEIAIVHPDWRVSATAAVGTLALLARRRSRLGATVVVALAAVAHSLIDPVSAEDTLTLFFLVLLTAWMAGSSEDRREAVAGLAVVVAAGVVVSYRFPSSSWGDLVWITLFFTFFWSAAFVLARGAQKARAAEERARRLALERAAAAEQAVADERQRIARELHDVVAHSISVMTVQAAGVRRLLRAEQERERQALIVVEETGREALAEMRRLLGVLRGANETPALAPQPSLRNVDVLLRQVREAGLPVELHVEGRQVDLPPGIDLSAYRIVQEALTNALKYAGPARAAVRVDYGADDVVIEVSNDGRVDAGGDGAGHGIPGMRERAAVCGGSLQCGPLDDGSGFVVRARLPITEPVPAR